MCTCTFACLDYGPTPTTIEQAMDVRKGGEILPLSSSEINGLRGAGPKTVCLSCVRAWSRKDKREIKAL